MLIISDTMVLNQNIKNTITFLKPMLPYNTCVKIIKYLFKINKNIIAKYFIETT